MPWYTRPAAACEYLETVHVASDRNLIDLRFPVQYVLRPDAGFRGYSGTVASGVLRKGAEITVLPSRQSTRVESIVTWDGELDEAFPPLAVTVQVADDIDISRGDLIVSPRNVPRMESEFEAILVWMSEQPLAAERPYIIKHQTTEVRAEVARIRYKFDVHTLGRLDVDELALNDIGRVHIRLSAPIGFDPYTRNRAMGSFILIDAVDNATVAGGMIIDRQSADEREPGPGADALDGAAARPQSQVSGDARAAALGHQPVTVWLTGLPRSGKTTIAYELEKQLFDAGCAVHVLDGVNLRSTLSEDLGFGALERSENVRRTAHVAKLCNDAGLITIVALIAPYRADRAEARAIIGHERFVEAHLSAPVAACEARDDSGLYARARKGEIARFTGVSAPYEPPDEPDIELPTHDIAVADAVARVRDLPPETRRAARVTGSGFESHGRERSQQVPQELWFASRSRRRSSSSSRRRSSSAVSSVSIRLGRIGRIWLSLVDPVATRSTTRSCRSRTTLRRASELPWS